MADLTLFGTLGSEIDIHVTPFQQVKAVSFLNGHHARIKIFITITVLIIEIDIRVEWRELCPFFPDLRLIY